MQHTPLITYRDIEIFRTDDSFFTTQNLRPFKEDYVYNNSIGFTIYKAISTHIEDLKRAIDAIYNHEINKYSSRIYVNATSGYPYAIVYINSASGVFLYPGPDKLIKLEKLLN